MSTIPIPLPDEALTFLRACPEAQGTSAEAPPRAAEAPQQTFAERYAEFIGIWEDGPADLAAEHDHYASGTPKRKQ